MAAYTREDLIAICEQAFVPEAKWENRDTASAQMKLGSCYALLKAGCDFQIITGGRHVSTDDQTIWLEIHYRGFQAFEHGEDAGESETFYLPTPERLAEAAGDDWY